MVAFDRLRQLFNPAPACGPICQSVSREVDTMRTADQLRLLAEKARC